MRIHFFSTLSKVLAMTFITSFSAQAEAIIDQDVEGPYPIHSATLENGLKVVVIPDHRAPVVTHMIWYQAGAADEKEGVSGIAHFLEHLMFKGTENYPDGRFSEIVSAVGGQENAFTGQDYTAYYQRVSKQNLPKMMEMEADRMRNLVLSKDAVNTERNVILEERKSRVDNVPASILGEKFNAALFQNHPYGIPIIGFEEEIRQLSREDAFDFYHQYYDPKRATLVVAGDVTLKEVLALTKDSYAKIPSELTDHPVRERPKEPQRQGIIEIAYEDEKVGQPYVQLSFQLPAPRDMADKHMAALQLFAQILGSGSTSELYKNLVIDKQQAVAAAAWYQTGQLDQTSFGLYAVPTPDVSLEEAKEALINEIKTLLEQGIDEETLQRIKYRYVAGEIFQQDNHTNLARMVGSALSVGRSIEDIQTSLKTLQSVTGDDIINVARQYLDFTTYGVAYLKKPLS